MFSRSTLLESVDPCLVDVSSCLDSATRTLALAVYPVGRKLNYLKMNGSGSLKIVEQATWSPFNVAALANVEHIYILLDENVQRIPKTVSHNNSPKQDLVSPTVEIGSFIEAQAGDTCPKCQSSTLVSNSAIEVGHTFYLGTKYSEPLDATVQLPGSSSLDPIEMGCFGIGVSRMISAIAEATHDTKGLRWPISVAPYVVEIIVPPTRKKVESDPIAELGLKLYQDLQAKLGEEEVMFDDRQNVSFFEKVSESELAGIPFQVMIGAKGYAAGQVEINCRLSGEKKTVPISEAVQVVLSECSRL